MNNIGRLAPQPKQIVKHPTAAAEQDTVSADLNQLAA